MMNTSTRKNAELMRRRNWVLSALLFLTVIFWTHSQTILPTQSREVTYEKLSEFAKYVKFKEEADPLLGSYETEIKYADSLIEVMRQKNQVAQAIIFELKAINNSKDIRLVNGNEKMKMAEESYKREIKSEKSKKWNWGAFGIIIGGAIGFLTAISL